MTALIWSFDRPLKRAVAVSPYGTYVVIGEDDTRWFVQFTHADCSAASGQPDHAYYRSMEEAFRACQRHGERFSADGSNRFMHTPIP